MFAYRRPKVGYVVTVEVMVVDAVATTLACGIFIASETVETAAVWAAGAGLLSVAVMEILRAQATPVDASTVPTTRFDAVMAAIRRERETAEEEQDDDSWTLTAVVISIVLSPFIAAFFLMRVALLYLVPVAIVLLFVMTNQTTTWRAVAAALVVGIGADVVNELLVVLPLRRRWLRLRSKSPLGGIPR